MANVRVFKITTGDLTHEQLLAKLEQIRALQDALLTAALTTVTAGNTWEYELDTGQTRQRVKYRTLSEVTAAMERADLMESRILAKLRGGRSTRLVNYKNFTGR